MFNVFTGTFPRAPLFNLTVAGLLTRSLTAPEGLSHLDGAPLPVSAGPPAFSRFRAMAQIGGREKNLQLREQRRVRTGFPFQTDSDSPFCRIVHTRSPQSEDKDKWNFADYKNIATFAVPKPMVRWPSG